MRHKVFAIILSDNDVFEGAETNEIVLTILALKKNRIEYQCFSPRYRQHHRYNKKTGKKRKASDESAVILLENVESLSKCIPDHFDALIIPAGLCVEEHSPTFSFNDKASEDNLIILEKIHEFKVQKKPVGYINIAPFLLPVVYRTGIILAIGDDVQTIADFKETGRVHKISRVKKVEVNDLNKVLMTPAYMLESNILEAKNGIDKLVTKLNDIC